jgi:hypothetical protein
MSQLAEAPSYIPPPERMREPRLAAAGGGGQALGTILPLVDADPAAHRDDPWPAGESARRLLDLPQAPPAEPNADGDEERLGAVSVTHRFIEAPGDSDSAMALGGVRSC